MSWAFISDQFGEITPYTVSDYLFSLSVGFLKNKRLVKKNNNNNSFESDT